MTLSPTLPQDDQECVEALQTTNKIEAAREGDKNRPKNVEHSSLSLLAFPPSVRSWDGTLLTVSTSILLKNFDSLRISTFSECIAEGDADAHFHLLNDSCSHESVEAINRVKVMGKGENSISSNEQWLESFLS